jgi:hypothetical protein
LLKGPNNEFFSRKFISKNARTTERLGDKKEQDKWEETLIDPMPTVLPSFAAKRRTPDGPMG